MNFPKTAFVDISVSFDLDKYLTEDDKEILLLECKDEDALYRAIEGIIKSTFSEIVNHDNIFIDLI